MTLGMLVAAIVATRVAAFTFAAFTLGMFIIIGKIIAAAKWLRGERVRRRKNQ